MKIIAIAKRDTTAYNRPRIDLSCVSYQIKAGESVEIVGIEKYGIHTFYSVAGGDYVYSDDVQIIRDVDFFYKNYRTKKLVRNNLNMVGGVGVSASLGNVSQYTSTYNFLKRFDDEEEGEGKFIEIDPFVGGGITGANREKLRIPISGSNTAGGGLIPAPVENPADYSNQVSNTGIGDFFGATGTVGEVLQGTTIGDLFNGQFLGKVATNIFNMIGTWLNNKLKFVIGFDISASEFLTGKYNGADNLSQGPYDSVLGPYATHYAYALPYYGPYASEYEQIMSRQITHAEPTQAMLNYFSYRIPTENYSLDQYAYQITGSQSNYYTGLPQVPDSNYTDPSKSVEKQFYKKMSPLLYDEVSDKLDKIRENFNLHVDRNTIFNKFNRFRVPTPDNELTTSRGHIFFSRPDLNLALDVDTGLENKGRINSGAHMWPLAANLQATHATLVKYLMGAEAGKDNSFIPILSHCCTGIDVSDDVLETQEVGDTFTGWKMVYGTSIIKSKTAGTVNIAFTDDNMLSVYKILKLWIEYINAVWHGEISPKEEHMKKHVLDYAISIYYFLTKATDDDILFFTKYTGCFPTAVPSSNFSDVLGQPIKRPNYSIPFAYARKDDFDPLRVAEFNHLSTGAYKYIPTYDYETLRVRKSFVGAPFVDTQDAGYLYKLRFRPE